MLGISTVNKLVAIENDVFSLKNRELSNELCVVISMVGAARVGKSTFINCFLSKILNSNISMVGTAHTASHCTLGIDYILCDYRYGDKIIKIVVFDCQGLMYEDSKYDDKLLSVIYAISNIIVYHDTNIINNQTLNSLTSLCIVANQIHDDDVCNKPMLYFRMKDYNLDSNAQENIDRTFEKRNDQYDSVRGAIKKLFPVIKPITTESLGKSQLSQLKNKQYLKICNDTDFGMAIDILLRDIITIYESTTTTIHNTFVKAHNIVDDINGNHNICFKDYDYYTLLIDKHFDDFWNKHVTSQLQEIIEPTAQQITNELCNATIEQVDEIINLLNTTFSKADESLLNVQRNKYYDLLKKPLLQSKQTCYEMASNIIASERKIILQRMTEYINAHVIQKNNLTFETGFINVIYAKIIPSPINSDAYNTVLDILHDEYKNTIYPACIILCKKNTDHINTIKQMCIDATDTLLNNLENHILQINTFTITCGAVCEHYKAMIENEMNAIYNTLCFYEFEDIIENTYKHKTYGTCSIEYKKILNPYVEEIKRTIYFKIKNHYLTYHNHLKQLFFDNFVAKHKYVQITAETVKYQTDYEFITLIIDAGNYCNSIYMMFKDLKCKTFGIKTGRFVKQNDGKLLCTMLKNDYNTFIEKLCEYCGISCDKFKRLVVQLNKFIEFSYNTDIFIKTVIDKAVFEYMRH